MYSRFLGKLLLIFILVFAASTAGAQVSQEKAQGDFRWSITPYAWLISLNGTIGAKGYDTTVNAPFTDLAKYLNLAAMVHAEVLYRDRVGLLTDFNYALLGDDASGKRVSLNGKTSIILTDLAAFYRVGTVPLGPSGTSSMDFDLLAGTRIWNLALKLNGDSRRGGRDVFKQRTWADPIVGARAQFHITDAWILSLRGGVGGFSVSSALTWDVTAALGYAFWEHSTVLLGYRAVGDTYDTGSGKNAFKFDATLSGPMLGFAFTF